MCTKNLEQRFDRLEQLALLAAKEALTMDDAVAYTGLSKTYLYTLVSRRAIPHWKSVGGKFTYFSKKELTAWLLNHKVLTTEEAEQQAAAYCLRHPMNKKGGAR